METRAFRPQEAPKDFTGFSRNKGMGFGHPKILIFLLALAPVLAFAAGQNTALLEADAKNRKGSDQSLENSATYAMTALMDLASMNVPGAIKNGTSAYGKYRNSETMDKIGDQSFAQAASLESARGGSGVSGVRKTDTTFRRLNPNFMRTGEAAKVAAEFEKRTGMTREQFLQHLSEASENKIPKNDPQLIDKVLSRYESFAAKIPNQEFRKNLTKASSMVPATVRNGLIAKAVNQFTNLFAGGPTETAADVSAPAPVVAQADASPSPAATTPEERAPASTVASTPTLGTLSAPVADGTDTAKNPLGNIVQAAIETQGQDNLTIFQLVNRRYRVWTPFLSRGERYAK